MIHIMLFYNSVVYFDSWIDEINAEITEHLVSNYMNEKINTLDKWNIFEEQIPSNNLIGCNEDNDVYYNYFYFHKANKNIRFSVNDFSIDYSYSYNHTHMDNTILTINHDLIMSITDTQFNADKIKLAHLTHHINPVCKYIKCTWTKPH